MGNVVLGAGRAIILGHRRLAAQPLPNFFDVSVKKTEEAVTMLTKLFGEKFFDELHRKVESGNQLAKYLKVSVDSLKRKKEMLQRALNEINKIIDREIIRKHQHFQPFLCSYHRYYYWQARLPGRKWPV